MVAVSKFQMQLPTLFALAREKSETSRVELAAQLADLMMDDDLALSLREQELLNELIDTLMQVRIPAVRRQFMEKFTNNIAHMPRKMALTLAGDTIDVARPVLLECESFTDDDLVHLIKLQGRDHAEVIAHRARVNEAVVDALVTTGDLEVMKAVAANLGARLSPKAVDVLTNAARFSEELGSPLLKRSDATADMGVRLYWWMKEEMRRYALQRFGFSAAQVDVALSKTIEALLRHHEFDKHHDERMEQVADWLVERDALSARVLPQVLRMGYYRLFSIILGRLTMVPTGLVDKIMEESGGRGLAVLCRSIGIDKASFVSLFLLSRGARDGEQVVHPRELSQALLAFDRLSAVLAADLLRSWKRDPSYFDRHANDDLIIEEA